MRRILYHPFFIKLLHWEYWSFNTVYIPIYIVWVALCIRARSFFFFNASNPTIENGGFVLESKEKIYQLIPKEYYPATLYFKKETAADELKKRVEIAGLNFPLIAKPDIGGKGKGVKKIYNMDELAAYLDYTKGDFLVQNYIDYGHEVGIFYYRYPNQEKGKISGIVYKELLTITGDGQSTIEALLLQDKRFILQLPVLRSTYKSSLKEVLPSGEKKILVPYGNHARGAKFLDISDKVNEQLTASMDNVCRQVDGFYFGRLDIRYNSWEELEQGKNFSIIELNGAGSEPTHIYDPKHSIFFAWKEIIRHWIILWKISRMNHKLKNIPYMKFSEGVKMLRDNSAFEKMMKENA